MVRCDSDDPFESILSPPPNESPKEKRAREHAEAKARKVSDSIDEQLQQEFIASREKQKPVKVLLLGHSGSGKSALLKRFLLRYAPHEWVEERAAWRVVIFLNLLCNVVHVLDAVLHEMSQSDDSLGAEHALASDPRPLRLAPLRRAQAHLAKMLGLDSTGVHTTHFTAPAGQGQKDGFHSQFGIVSTHGWGEEVNEVTDILVRCKTDIKGLWEDVVVQQILARQITHIEDSPGFFLNDVERIASSDYEPTDNDIVRARLRTVGVQEHKFSVDVGNEWVMYDVGGMTSLPAVWTSIFDDVDTIIFLSPLSCFDERLREDSRVNRLEDSYRLWCSVCSSPILAKADIILLFNKCDILQQKLKRGVRVKDFVPSFEDRENDTSSAVTYFRGRFKMAFASVSPRPRGLSVHAISTIDEGTVLTTCLSVRDGILRRHIARAIPL